MACFYLAEINILKEQKMKKLTRTASILATALLVCLCFYGTGYAWHGYRGHGYGNGNGYYGNGYYGNGQPLSQEQMDTAKKIFDNSYAGMEATRRALAAKSAELDAQLSSQNPDNAKIESLSREIGELQGKMLAARADVRSQLEKAGIPSDYYGFNPGYGPGYGPNNGPGWHMYDGGGYGWHGSRHGGRGGCWWQ